MRHLCIPFIECRMPVSTSLSPRLSNSGLPDWDKSVCNWSKEVSLKEAISSSMTPRLSGIFEIGFKLLKAIFNFVFLFTWQEVSHVFQILSEWPSVWSTQINWCMLQCPILPKIAASRAATRIRCCLTTRKALGG